MVNVDDVFQRSRLKILLVPVLDCCGNSIQQSKEHCVDNILQLYIVQHDDQLH